MEEISRLFSIKIELPCKGQNRKLKIWKEIYLLIESILTIIFAIGGQSILGKNYIQNMR